METLRSEQHARSLKPYYLWVDLVNLFQQFCVAGHARALASRLMISAHQMGLGLSICSLSGDLVTRQAPTARAAGGWETWR